MEEQEERGGEGAGDGEGARLVLGEDGQEGGGGDERDGKEGEMAESELGGAVGGGAGLGCGVFFWMFPGVDEEAVEAAEGAEEDGGGEACGAGARIPKGDWS